MSVEQLDGIKHRIVEIMRRHRIDGMTPREVARELRISLIVATAEMRALRKRGFVLKDPNRAQRDGQIIWFTDEEGLQTLNDRFRAKERKCLGGCGRMFVSLHAGNRICPKCSGNELIGGVEELVA